MKRSFIGAFYMIMSASILILFMIFFVPSPTFAIDGTGSFGYEGALFSHPVETIPARPIYEFSHPIETVSPRPIGSSWNTTPIYERLPESFLLSYLQTPDPWSAILAQLYFVTLTPTLGSITYSDNTFKTCSSGIFCDGGPTPTFTTCSSGIFCGGPSPTLNTCGIFCDSGPTPTLTTCSSGIFCGGPTPTLTTCSAVLFCDGGSTSKTCDCKQSPEIPPVAPIEKSINICIVPPEKPITRNTCYSFVACDKLSRGICLVSEPSLQLNEDYSPPPAF